MPTWWHRDIFWWCFASPVKFSSWSKFHVNVITGSGVMTIFFIRDWPEIWKLEIPLSEFWPISEDWGEFEIPRMSLKKCYWMLQNARNTVFTVSELLKENQKGGGGVGGLKLPPPPTPTPRPSTHPNTTQIMVKKNYYNIWKSHYRQLQVPIIIFNKKKLLWIFLASPTQRSHHETFWLLYRELLLMNVSKPACRIVLVLLWFCITDKTIKTLGFHNNTHLLDQSSFGVLTRGIFKTLSNS